MKTVELNVSTKEKNAEGKEEKVTWQVPCQEFESADITVTLSADAAKFLTPESVLSLVNRQYSTDVANESRRERTSGAPKRVETEGMIRVLMSLGMTREQAEAKISEARRAS